MSTAARAFIGAHVHELDTLEATLDAFAAEQTAVLRAALDRRDALLRDIAADNDPEDGCAYADLARAVLAEGRS